MINYEELRGLAFPDQVQDYDEKDVMLYALGVGFGGDPSDAGQLQYVYEENLRVVPTMPAVFCHPGQWVREPKLGLNWKKIVHGNLDIRLHQPLAPNASVLAKTENTLVADKGAGSHAIIQQERTLSDQSNGALLASLKNTYIALGQGGFSADNGLTDTPPPAPLPLPEEPADFVCDLPVLPQLALIYRLSGDRNPLHCDPAFAVQAGFPRPILHGLCTFGLAAHAILKTCLNYDAAAFGGMSARFSAPVYPGETIRTEIWQRDDKLLFRSRTLERDVVVLNNGEVSTS